MEKLLLGAVMATLWAGAAYAQSSMDISHERLMLQAGQDRADVHANLTRKAKRTCRRHGEFGTEARRYEKACTEELLDLAVTKLGDNRLTALHQGHIETRLVRN